jgi:hypothetical protein
MSSSRLSQKVMRRARRAEVEREAPTSLVEVGEEAAEGHSVKGGGVAA